MELSANRFTLRGEHIRRAMWAHCNRQGPHGQKRKQKKENQTVGSSGETQPNIAGLKVEGDQKECGQQPLKAGKGKRKDSLPLCVCVCVLHLCMCAKSCLTLQPHGLQPARLLCQWDFPGKNTTAGWHFLLQGVFLTQGQNLRLPHWQTDSLLLSHLGSPFSPGACAKERSPTTILILAQGG